MDKIYNHKVRVSIFTLFMLQFEEIRCKDAIQFICERFNMERSNAFRFIRELKEFNLLERRIAQNGDSFLIFIGKI